MTNLLPGTPDPAPATPECPAEKSLPLSRDRLLDLAALLLLLAVTAGLYLLIGPSAGMVTGTATGLYTTYRRTSTPPAEPPGPDPDNQERP